MESEAVIRFNVGDQKIDCTPRNTALYRHMGHHAMVDHVFIKERQEGAEGAQTGKILFLRPMFGDAKIDEITNYMMNSGYEVHLNIREPAKGDLIAFDNMISQRASALEDFIPEEWADGTSTE